MLAAIRAAYDEPTEWVKAEPPRGGGILSARHKEKVTAEELVAMMGKPEIQFTQPPARRRPLRRVHAPRRAVKGEPKSWRDLFFPEAHGLEGN